QGVGEENVEVGLHGRRRTCLYPTAELLKCDEMIIPWVETVRLTLSDSTKQVLDRGVVHPSELELPSLVEVRSHDARDDRRVTDLQALEKSKLLDLLS